MREKPPNGIKTVPTGCPFGITIVQETLIGVLLRDILGWSLPAEEGNSIRNGCVLKVSFAPAVKG